MNVTCPFCNTVVPAVEKEAPSKGTTILILVVVDHNYAKDPGLGKCQGSGAYLTQDQWATYGAV